MRKPLCARGFLILILPLVVTLVVTFVAWLGRAVERVGGGSGEDKLSNRLALRWRRLNWTQREWRA